MTAKRKTAPRASRSSFMLLFVVILGTARGQVVQPKGTYDEVNDIRQRLSNQNRLNISPHSKVETAQLRNILHSSKTTNPANLDLLKSLGGSKTSSGTVRAEQESVSYIRNQTFMNHNAFTNPEYFGLTEPLEGRKKMFHDEEVWHMPDFGASAQFHELVTLSKVEQVLDFEVDYDRNIEKWLAFRSNWRVSRPVNLVGMTEKGVVLVKKTESGYNLVQEVLLGATPRTFEIFEDVVGQERVGIAVVSVGHELIWLQTNADFTSLEEMWRWQLHKSVSVVRRVSIEGSQLLLLLSDEPTVELYEFRYPEKLFWVAQVIVLPSPSRSVGVLKVAGQLVLCISQPHEVLVYANEDGALEKRHLAHQYSVEAPDLTVIRGFEVGGKAFLAVGCEKPKILAFTEHNFEEVATLSINNVHLWLPINVHTYRDDLVLLAEHSLDFGTHSSNVVSAFVWNGETFSPSPFVPCFDEDLDESQGLSCILDARRPNGLSGSTFVQKKDSIALVVPQKNAPSVLYKLFYELRPASDPVIDELREIEQTYEVIARMEEHQDAVIRDAFEALQNVFDPHTPLSGAINLEIGLLSAPVVHVDDEVAWNEVLFGDQGWSAYDEHIAVESLHEYLAASEGFLDQITDSFLRRNLRASDADSPETRIPVHANGIFGNRRLARATQINGPVVFETLNLHELQVENVNGIPAKNLIFSNNNEVTLGHLVVNNLLSVENLDLGETGKINGISPNDFVSFRTGLAKIDKLQLQTVRVRNQSYLGDINGSGRKSSFRANEEERVQARKVVIRGNLNVDEINGEKWTEIVRQITPRNLPGKLSNLTVKGSVIVNHAHLDIQNLNQHNFLKDLVFSRNEEPFIQITGRKKFKDSLVAHEIDCESIDGILPSTLITLSDHGTVEGKTSFSNLEVSSALEVNGNIEGEQLDEFQENLSLLQTRILNAAVIFNNLQVFGPIKVRGKFANLDLDGLLSRVVYQDSAKIVVDSYKSFDSATFAEGVKLKSGLLNDVAVKHIATKSTEQHLGLPQLHGDVVFQKLELSGLFDGINVTELALNSIKLSGDQYTQAELVFGGGLDSYFGAHSLVIETHLNNLGTADFVNIKTSPEIPGVTSFRKLLTHQANVLGNVQSFDKINGVALQEFDRTRLSVNLPQVLDHQVYLERLKVTGNLRNAWINGHETSIFTKNLLKSQSVRNLMFSGEILIENMDVLGNVDLKSVNGRDFDVILENALWLNRPNSFSEHVNFVHPVVVRGNFSSYGNLNQGLFGTFVQDLALRGQSHRIRGAKVFQNGLDVTQNVDTEFLNEEPVKNLVLKSDQNFLSRNLVVKGGLKAGHLNVKGSLNGAGTQNLRELYEFEEASGTHVVKTKLSFGNHIKVGAFEVQGYFNDIPDIADALKNIVRADRSFNVTGPKSFLSISTFESGFNVGSFNDEKFGELMSQIVLLDADSEAPTVIKGLVRFSEPVFASHVDIKGALATQNIADCSPLEWVYNGVMVNRPENVIGTVTLNSENFACSSLNAIKLNGKPMDDLLTLHEPQNFNVVDIKVKELHLTNEIRVGNLVNGFNFPLARENTFMNTGRKTPQQIATTGTIFQNLRVLDSLTIGNLNGIDFDNVATLSAPVFHSPLEIRTLNAEFVETEDFISGINFNYWFDTSVSSVQDHNIFSPWTIENLHLRGPLKGNGKINGLELVEVEKKLNEIHSRSSEYVSNVASRYQKTCRDIQSLAQKSTTGITFFKYLEFAFILTEQTPINGIFRFRSHEAEKVLVNIGCDSAIYRWNPKLLTFERAMVIKTGHVTATVVVEFSAEESYLVVLSDKRNDRCQYKGLNIHKIQNGVFTSYRKFQEPPEIRDIHSSRGEPLHFFAICSDNKVRKYDINLNLKEEWALPPNHSQYWFLPDGFVSGDIGLSDGLQIVTISSESKRVSKRQVDEITYAFPVTYYSASPGHWEESEENEGFVGETAQVRGDQDPNEGFERPKELPELQTKEDAAYANALRGQTGVINEQVGLLKEVLGLDNSTANSTSFEETELERDQDFFRSHHEPSHPGMYDNSYTNFRKSSIQSVEERQFSDQLRDKAAKINEKTSKLESLVTNTFKLNDLDEEAEEEEEESDIWRSGGSKKKHKDEDEDEPEEEEKTPALQSSADQQFTDHLRDKVASMNERIDSTLVSPKPSPNDSDLDVSQEDDTDIWRAGDSKKDKKKEQKPPTPRVPAPRIPPTLQSTDDQRFTDHLRDEVGSMNEKIDQLGANIEKKPGLVMAENDGEKPSTLSHLESEGLQDQFARWESFARELKAKNATKSKPKVDNSPAQDFSFDGFFSSSAAPQTTTTPKSSTTTRKSTTTTPKPRINEEPIVGKEMLVKSVNFAANSFLPAKGKGEVLVLNVGVHGGQRKLFAVVKQVESKRTIPGNDDTIQIYEDIYENKLFQTIPCYQPSGLSAVHLKDETLLAFLEGKTGIRVYAYRGIEGFKLVTNFNLNKEAHGMTSFGLMQTVDSKQVCFVNYLAAISDTEIAFYKVHTEPKEVCGLKEGLKCD